MTIDIQLRAVWVERVGYRYDTILDGKVLVRGSRDPEFDTARVLMARGLWDPLESTCRHASLSIL